MKLAEQGVMRLAFFAVLFLVATLARPSEACGGLSCAAYDDIQPVDGSNDVPLNPELRVHYFGTLDPAAESVECDVDLTVLRLQPAEGEPIDVNGTLLEQGDVRAWLMAKPGEELLPDMQYELQMLLASNNSDVCDCRDRQWTTVSAFITGEATDEEAPLFAGITEISFGDRIDSDTDCGRTNGVPILSEAVAATDDSLGVRYNIYADGQLIKSYAPDLGTAQRTQIFASCDSTGLNSWAEIDPGAMLEVRAVDLAGNESEENPPLLVDDKVCSPSSSGDAPPVEQTDTKGCSVSVANRADGSGVLLSLLALIFLRRRGRTNAQDREDSP